MMKPSQYLLYLGASIALCISVAWAIVLNHSNGTHAGSTTQREMVLIKEHIDNKFERLYKELDQLRHEIKAIR